MKKLFLISAALFALASPASADVLLSLSSVSDHSMGPQSTSNPCIICATNAQQPASMGYNNFTEAGNISSFNMYSTTPTATVADGVLGTPYTVQQLTGVVGAAFDVAIDVNTTRAAGETLQLFEVFDTTLNTRIAHYAGPTLIGSISNNGNGFADWILNTVDLTGLAATDGILFHAYWNGASDGGESFFLVSSDPVGGVPEASTWAMMILGFAGIGFMAYRKKMDSTGFRFA